MNCVFRDVIVGNFHLHSYVYINDCQYSRKQKNSWCILDFLSTNSCSQNVRAVGLSPLSWSCIVIYNSCGHLCYFVSIYKLQQPLFRIVMLSVASSILLCNYYCDLLALSVKFVLAYNSDYLWSTFHCSRRAFMRLYVSHCNS